MECLSVVKVPDGTAWTFEIKLDGFRLEAIRAGGKVTLYSRRGNIVTQKYASIADALQHLPNGTVLDGELVALGSDGRPSFRLIQNYRAQASPITYFVFDLLIHKDKDLTRLPLSERRSLLRKIIKPNAYVKLSESVSSAAAMMEFIRDHGLEGIVAKRSDSFYEAGQRSGSWVKHRINLAQEFVIGGYTTSHLGIDALILGVYEGKDLRYVSRVRAGFTPRTRIKVFERIKHLKTDHCPFVNLPERTAGRWGQGLTAKKMQRCVWLKPESVAQAEFLEWTADAHLRHTVFVALREDKAPRKVVRET
jgi:DNA ligase D-like protein (predicted ligase)